MLRAATLGLAALLAIGVGGAQACKGSKVLFSDDFRQVDDSWGAQGDAVTIEDGKVKVKAGPSNAFRLKYGGTLFDDADVCATLRMPNDVKSDTEPYAGIIFWAQDYSNFYVWQISAIGTASLWREVKGKWINVLDWRKVPAIKLGAGAKNVLRVVTRKGSVDVYVNDDKVGTVKAPMPDGGGEIGFLAVSEKSKRDAWKFSDLKVTSVEP